MKLIKVTVIVMIGICILVQTDLVVKRFEARIEGNHQITNELLELQRARQSWMNEAMDRIKNIEARVCKKRR